MDAVDENEEDRMEDIPRHPRLVAEEQELARQQLAESAARRKAAAARDPQPPTPSPEIVRPQVDRMEDLAWNPARLAEFERQERLGIGEGHPGASPAPLHQHTPHAPQLTTAQRQRNQAEQERQKRAAAAANRARLSGKMVARARQPQTQTHLPQMSTAQRSRNQADQPRDRGGKYAEKQPSKWKAAPSAPRTALKRVSTPARPVTSKTPWPHGGGQARGQSAQARTKNPKTTNRLPSKRSMRNKPVHQKVGWVVKRWFRRKKRLFRALFSWKG